MEPTSPFDVEWLDPQLAPVLLGVIVLAVAGTAVLFCCGVVAYARRRSTRYLVIAVVLGLLVARSVVGLGTAFDLVPMAVHHLVEHGVDLTIAVLVLYIVYRSGSGSGSESGAGAGSTTRGDGERDPNQDPDPNPADERPSAGSSSPSDADDD